MKHCIIVKFKKDVDYKSMLGDIQALFHHCLEIDGVSDVKILENCIARDNRYDICIEITMKEESLPLYDDCKWHHLWKENYSQYIEKKAIFDFND